MSRAMTDPTSAWAAWPGSSRCSIPRAARSGCREDSGGGKERTGAACEGCRDSSGHLRRDPASPSTGWRRWRSMGDRGWSWSSVAATAQYTPIRRHRTESSGASRQTTASTNPRWPSARTPTARRNLWSGTTTACSSWTAPAESPYGGRPSSRASSSPIPPESCSPISTATAIWKASLWRAEPSASSPGRPGFRPGKDVVSDETASRNLTGREPLTAGGACALKTTSLSKLYRTRGGRVRGLAPLSLEIMPGESAALVGPNGCGKTTALKIVATLVEPCSGSATVFGHDVVRRPLRARSLIGAVFSTTRSFYWRLSAGHNLSFFAAAQGMTPGAAASKARALAVELGIVEYLGVPARRLSRGILARLSLVRALLHDPGLLLLDEPFAAMDGGARERVWEALEGRTSDGLSLLVATHDPSQVRLCDRVFPIAAPE
ncbi:MAG: ATP-binding cassette domain-containing protein [Candidatus Eisenbacteria bacterium]|nr:ATP-binding cassette domain-containing protein [Candidatus Eisenbacteria bacterium]